MNIMFVCFEITIEKLVESNRKSAQQKNDRTDSYNSIKWNRVFMSGVWVHAEWISSVHIRYRQKLHWNWK